MNQDSNAKQHNEQKPGYTDQPYKPISNGL